MAKYYNTNEENLIRAMAEADEEVIINGKHTVIEYGVNGKTITGTLLKANSRDGTALVKTATHIISVTNVQSIQQELSNEQP